MAAKAFVLQASDKTFYTGKTVEGAYSYSIDDAYLFWDYETIRRKRQEIGCEIKTVSVTRRLLK